MSAEKAISNVVPFNTILTLASLGDIPGNTTLQYYINEITDQPDVRLDTLTAAERGKLFFRFVSAAHIDPYMEQIAEAAGVADYYISEGVIHSPSRFRPVMDVVTNMSLHGKGVPYHLPFSVFIEKSQSDSILYGQLGPEVASGTLLDACRQNIDFTASELPVMRTMDMSERDIIPNTSITLGDALKFESRARAVGNLLTDTNEYLLKTIDARVLAGGTTMAARNNRQYLDISTIAANAVRRHPEKDKIVVAVLHGMGHDTVAKQILDQPGIAGEHMYVPAAETSDEFRLVTLRKQAYDELVRNNGVLSQETRQRILLYDYMAAAFSTFDDFPSRLRVLQVAEQAALTLSGSQVGALLKSIDHIKDRFSLVKLFAPTYFARHIAHFILSETIAEPQP